MKKGGRLVPVGCSKNDSPSPRIVILEVHNPGSEGARRCLTDQAGRAGRKFCAREMSAVQLCRGCAGSRAGRGAGGAAGGDRCSWNTADMSRGFAVGQAIEILHAQISRAGDLMESGDFPSGPSMLPWCLDIWFLFVWCDLKKVSIFRACNWVQQMNMTKFKIFSNGNVFDFFMRLASPVMSNEILSFGIEGFT